MKFKVIGMGWKIDADAKIEGDEITFNKGEFDEIMNLIAYTHDTVGGWRLPRRVRGRISG